MNERRREGRGKGKERREKKEERIKGDIRRKWVGKEKGEGK